MNTYSGRLDALGDPTRRAIFERLALRPQSVGELARGLPVSRPAVSQHLKFLKQTGLVSVTLGPGNRRVYRVDPTSVAEIRAYFDRFWKHALTAFKAAAEKEDSR